MDQEQMRCENCVYFECFGEYIMGKIWGRCRRLPPMRYWREQKIVDGHNVVMEFDWCGEFQPKGLDDD